MKIEQNPISISLHQSSACVGLFPSLNIQSTTVFWLKFGFFSSKTGKTYIVDEKVIIENRKCVSSNSEFANLFLSIKTVLFESFVKHWNISSRDIKRFPILHPSCIETDTCLWRLWQHQPPWMFFRTMAAKTCLKIQCFRVDMVQ